jgi:spore coat protein CotH
MILPVARIAAYIDPDRTREHLRLTGFGASRCLKVSNDKLENMTQRLKLVLLPGMVALAFCIPGSNATAKEGSVHLQIEGTNLFMQVDGSKDDEWRFEASPDFGSWTNASAFKTVYSGKANAAWASAGITPGDRCFYRAVQTDGLFDRQVLRTLALTFTQTGWQSLLTKGRTTGSNTIGTLVTDGRMTNFGVGVRYRGNTSFTGMGGGGGAPTKKSLNVELNYTNDTYELMGYQTINLNNAYGDETIMRESLYFNIMRNYTICPHACLVNLYINDEFWGVYSFVQQENGDLIKEWCPSSDGDRWRAPNMPGMGGGGIPGPGGVVVGGGPGGQASGVSALSYLGTNIASYRANYELKTDNSTNAWQRLMHATDVLNNTPINQLRDAVEEVLAVDRWLWFLALENVFADDDSYFNKGADYCFYFEPETGRIHPVEHDGNESFMAGDAQLSPVQGTTGSNRPVLSRLLGIPELRQRYLAHMRTVLQEYFNPPTMTALISQFSALSIAAITADPKKNYTMAGYNTDLTALKTFVANRYRFLTNHAELRPASPAISAVNGPVRSPAPNETPFVTAQVVASGTDGIDTVWLYHRGKSYGRFARVQMIDDGAHGDGAAGDGVYGAGTTNYAAGTKVRFYVEARSANSAKAACFAPARAEEATFSYRVGLATATNTPVVINELMADNLHTLADPQGEYDDWIELRNLTGQEVDLTGHYLSDDPTHPRKWQFPAGTMIPANGFVIVWADEDGSAAEGLHANFKLASSGEELLLLDTDANLNAVLDVVSFGAQQTDVSYGRLSDNADIWGLLDPTPGQSNTGSR